MNVLRILLIECLPFRDYALNVYFPRSEWKDMFTSPCKENYQCLSPAITCQCSMITKMPFWHNLKKSKRTKTNDCPSQGESDGDISCENIPDRHRRKHDLHTSQDKCADECFLCQKQIMGNNAPIICQNCPMTNRVLCLADYLLSTTNAPPSSLLPKHG